MTCCLMANIPSLLPSPDFFSCSKLVQKRLDIESLSDWPAHESECQDAAAKSQCETIAHSPAMESAEYSTGGPRHWPLDISGAGADRGAPGGPSQPATVAHEGE